jgi:hypothetical protein
VVANSGANTVSVLVGNGDGSFQGTTNFGVGSRPDSVAVADVNGDGRPDLVAANSGGGLGDSKSVSVLLGNRNAATHFQVSAPANATAGMPFTITVTALTAGNELYALYTGTVHFTSSDAQAVLPANYTFTKGDVGVHTFTVTLKTAGSQTIHATDKKTSSITGSAVVTVTQSAAPGPRSLRGSRRGDSAEVAVTAAAPSPFRVTAIPSTAASTGRGAFGSVVTGHRGTVTFTSSDRTAGPPGNDTFTSTHRGVRSFSMSRHTTGSQTITASVTADAGGGAARAPNPFDPAFDVLSPARVDIFFAQVAIAPTGR